MPIPASNPQQSYSQAEGEPMKADDPRMIAMLAHSERRGVKLEPGKH